MNQHVADIITKVFDTSHQHDDYIINIVFGNWSPTWY
jgi:hypothetical protein